MRHFRSFLVATVTICSLARAQDGRVFSPRNVTVLEGESRDEWQLPSKVVEALRIRPGSVVADIGTGSGYFVPHLCLAVGPDGRVYAVDIQQAMLAFVQRKIERLQLTNVTTVLSHENDTRLDRASVDLALLVDVYHELGSPRALMSNIAQILRPNGRLAIIDFFSDRELPDVGPPPRYRVPEERLIAEVESVGFKLVEQHSFLPYQYFLVFKLSNPSLVKRQGGRER